jgi:2-octaprenyl-6-methoxyphenol hydroxylase
MTYDMIIVGGGMVGAGLATALRDSGLSIALIDAKLPSNNDPRLFALNLGSCEFLGTLGIWGKLKSYAAPIHQVHVSNQGRFGSVRLSREDVSLPALGYVIPAFYIETALNDALIKHSREHQARITLYRPARLISLQQKSDTAEVTLATEKGEITITGSIIIGADGTESVVRSQSNIKTDVFDYKQSAIVTRTTLQRSHANIAYERFNRDGAIAMLPLLGTEGDDRECATIWTADNEVISRLSALSDEAFLQALQNQFGYRLGRLQKISKRHAFPLRMVRAEKSVDQCVLLLGNSAHTLHPVAAQGFNLALYEAAALVKIIREKLSRQTAFTAADLLRVNEETQKHQAKTIGVSHRLARLFSSDSVLMNIALQAGMIGFDLATPVKKRFIKGILGKVAGTQEQKGTLDIVHDKNITAEY